MTLLLDVGSAAQRSVKTVIFTWFLRPWDIHAIRVIKLYRLLDSSPELCRLGRSVDCLSCGVAVGGACFAVVRRYTPKIPRIPE